MDEQDIKKMEILIKALHPRSMEKYKEIAKNLRSCIIYRSLICVVNSMADTTSDNDPGLHINIRLRVVNI